MVASLSFAQSPVFRSDTRAVEVTLVATRADGSLVNDLTRDELRVFDNNHEQTIASFESIGTVKGSTGAASTASGSRPPSRTIIVLDALNTFCGDQIYGREAVSRVLEKLPQGTERIALFTLGDKFSLLSDFSTDAASVQGLVDDYHGERPFFGVDLDYPSKDYPCDVFKPRPPPPNVEEFAFRQEQRLTSTLDALRLIARRMKTVQGEKSLLWITGGFPPPSSHQSMESAVAQLADAKVKLFPVDARGIPTGQGAVVNIQTMDELAEPTGGRTYSYSNDTTALVQAALDDSKQGYLLTFSPKEYREDGSFHELRLKTSRKGVDLRYRPSYIASPTGR